MLEWFGVKLLSFDSVFGLESESNCELEVQGDEEKNTNNTSNARKTIMHTKKYTYNTHV